MNYMPPICDCGEPLLYRILRNDIYTAKIFKNGGISKKLKREISDDVIGDSLYCPNCGNIYEINFLFGKKERVVRGNLEKNIYKLFKQF